VRRCVRALQRNRCQIDVHDQCTQVDCAGWLLPPPPFSHVQPGLPLCINGAQPRRPCPLQSTLPGGTTAYVENVQVCSVNLDGAYLRRMRPAPARYHLHLEICSQLATPSRTSRHQHHLPCRHLPGRKSAIAPALPPASVSACSPSRRCLIAAAQWLPALSCTMCLRHLVTTDC